MKSTSENPSIIQPVVMFYALAFAISWLIWSPLIFILAMQ